MSKYNPAYVATLVAAAVRAQGGTISDADLTKAVAIAGRESSWSLGPGAHNNNAATGDNSYGWWQINFRNGAHDPHALGLNSPEDLLIEGPNGQGPWANAQAFAKIFLGSGFYSWGPYKGQSELAGVTPDVMTAAQQGVAQARSKGYLDAPYLDQLHSNPSLLTSFTQDVGFGGSFADVIGGIPGNLAGGIGDAASSAADQISSLNPLSGVADLISKVMGTIFNGEFWKWVGLGALGVVLLWAAIIYTNKDEISGAASKAAMGGI